jgi:hypothetical protein
LVGLTIRSERKNTEVLVSVKERRSEVFKCSGGPVVE